MTEDSEIIGKVKTYLNLWHLAMKNIPALQTRTAMTAIKSQLKISRAEKDRDYEYRIQKIRRAASPAVPDRTNVSNNQKKSE